jgi:hypothetical protein
LLYGLNDEYEFELCLNKFKNKKKSKNDSIHGSYKNNQATKIDGEEDDEEEDYDDIQNHIMLAPTTDEISMIFAFIIHSMRLKWQ